MESVPSAVGSGDNEINTISDMAPMAISGHSSPILRGAIARCVRVRTLADSLPTILLPIVTSGKMSVLVFAASQLLLLFLCLPLWLLSFILSELGVYAAAVCTVFLLGRAILRMIAFPGSSHRVSNEIEKEFAKYSVRIITSSATSLIDLGAALQQVSGGNNPNAIYYEIPSIWKRAKSYRDRVLGVYYEVLHSTLQEDANIPSNTVASSTSPLNKYGNNVLVGDIGDLSGLTPNAIADGRTLLNHLEIVLSQMDGLENQGKQFFESSRGKFPESARPWASKLVAAATNLRDYVESLKPVSASGELSTDSDATSVGEVHRRLEEEQNGGGSIMDTIRKGISTIVPMLDPPLHTSIFGFDVLRGCVLSRYQGARQLWVQRPSGGMIDCIYIPGKSDISVSSVGDVPPRTSKAILYCNPNAGLIEVATGMSLAGGNVSSDIDNIVNDNCWTDFYTNLGFDMYLFNYAGFGRSHGAASFGFCNGPKTNTYVQGAWGRIKRIFSCIFLGFRPTPDTLRADGLAVASYILSQINVKSLVHGESIGGVAASHTARKLTENVQLKDKVSLLLCDRTFCNLEAVAQRLVGGWSGYAIRVLAPLWSTDVVGDFLAASCPKIVANDSADAIIADSSSLRAGVSFWKEIKRGASSTKGIGWMMDAPLHYRMADWENAPVSGSRYVLQPRIKRMTAPIWPADKYISLDEAFHFAACAKRVGKIASLEKKRFAVRSSAGMVGNEAFNPDSCEAPIYLIWKYLGCCEGLCGAPLGVSVKGGFDTTVTWLCSLCVFGGQTIVEGMEHRHRWSSIEAFRNFHQLGQVTDSDFDCRPSDYESQESETVVHPKPIPEVLRFFQVILEENPDDEILNSVMDEVAFIQGTLEYVVSRLSSKTSIEKCWRSRHLHSIGPMTEGSFMNLHCGHNNPFSSEEREKLKALLEQISSTSPSHSAV